MVAVQKSKNKKKIDTIACKTVMPTKKTTYYKRRKLRAFCRRAPGMFLSNNNFFGDMDVSEWCNKVFVQFDRKQGVKFIKGLSFRNDFFAPGDTPELLNLLDDNPPGTYFVTVDATVPNNIFIYYTVEREKMIYRYEEKNKDDNNSKRIRYKRLVREASKCCYVLSVNDDRTVQSVKSKRREAEAFVWNGKNVTKTQIEWNKARTKNIFTALDYLRSVGLINNYLFQNLYCK